MLNTRFTYFLLSLLLSAALQTEAQQQTLETEIEFTGLDRLDEQSLRDVLNDRGASRWQVEDETALRSILIEAAGVQGYPFARIDSVRWVWKDDSATVTARVYVREGPQLRTGRIFFEGNAGLTSEELERALDLSQGSVFSEAMINADLQRLVSVYDKAGYPFAETRLEDLALRREEEEAVADIVIGITEGPLFFIDEISVEGNSQTNTDVIVRETRIGEHERYDPDKLTDIRRRLERLQFFSEVQEPRLYLRDSTGGIMIRVTEGNTNQFDGVIGYQPPRGTEERGSFTGLVNVSFRNIFGTGRRLDARWERATSEISELELHYLEPWLAGLPVNVSGGLYQRLQDSAYVRRSFDGAVSFLWSSDVQLTGRVE